MVSAVNNYFAKLGVWVRSLLSHCQPTWENLTMFLCSKVFSPNSIAALLTTSLLFFISPGAFAQSGSENSSDLILEEVIVTASKRAVAIQDLPLSVSALQGSDLEDGVAFNFADFAESVPGLSFNGNEPGNDKLIIRGISTDSFNAQLQSTVGVYIDEMPGIDTFIPTSTPDLHMFDVDRVEVLRGPQGTLWGSSAMGGAIRIITNNPDVTENEYAGRITAGSVSDGDFEYSLDAMGNFVLSPDSLALRLTVYTRTDAGYLDAPNLGKTDSNETTVSGGRASLRWAASDNWTVDLTAMYQKIDADDGAAAWLNDPLDPTVSATTKDRIRFNYIPETRDQRLTTGNLVIQYDASSFSFVSSTTIGDMALESVSDQTSNTSLLVAPITGGTVFEAGFFNDDQSDTLTQEFRLLSTNPDGALDWVIGAFYLDNERELRSYIGVLSNAEMYPGSLLPGDATLLQGLDNGRTEKAVFGEVTWHISDRWDATAGARYFDNEQDFKTVLIFPPFAPGFPPFETGGDTTTSESDVTPKFSVAFRPNDDMMFYALASQGYRLGGVNQAALDFPFPIPETYDSDTLWNYELGARTTWNGGRTVLNATLFHVDWKDIQSAFRLALPGLPPFPYFVNTGTAHSTGIEFELTALLSENWEFHTALTVLEAEIDEVSEVAGGISNVQPGAKLPGTPEFQASSWIRYMFTMFDKGSSVRFSHRYVGESNYSLDSPAVQGDYNVFDLLLNSQISDNLSLTFYVKNLADDDGVTSTIPAIPGFADKRYLLRPRTIGLSLQGYF